MLGLGAVGEGNLGAQILNQGSWLRAIGGIELED